jgi:hypothetical protein
MMQPTDPTKSAIGSLIAPGIQQLPPGGMTTSPFSTETMTPKKI